MTARVHLARGSGVAICGTIGRTVVEPDVAKAPVGVTCRLCQRRHELEQIAHAQAEAERRAEARRDAIPAAVHEKAQEPIRAADRRILDRSIAGEDLSTDPKWPNAKAALNAYFAWRDEDVPIASATSKERFMQPIGGTAAGPRSLPGQQLDLTDVGAVLTRACRAAAASLKAASVVLSEEQVRQIVELRIGGSPVSVRMPGRKTRLTHRTKPMTKAEVAALIGVPEHWTDLAVKHAVTRIEEALAEKSLARLSPKPVRQWDPANRVRPCRDDGDAVG